MRQFAIGILMAGVMSGTSAWGHEAKGPHGGKIADVGAYHVELVAKGTDVEVYVTDAADKPVTTDAFKGLAILAVGGKSQRIDLISAGGNKLHGKAAATLTAHPKGVVQIINANGKNAQGQFK